MVSSFLSFGLEASKNNAQTRILEKFGFGTSLINNLIKNEGHSAVNDLYKSQIDLTGKPLMHEYGIDGWLSGNDNVCTDGKDDGMISFGQKISNFFEGICKTITGTIKDIASNPKKLMGAIAGVAITSVLAFLCPPLALAIGVVAGVGLIAKGIKDVVNSAEKANEADTDAEAMEAWEGIGAGTFEAGVGVFSTYVCGSGLYRGYVVNNGRFVRSTFENELINCLKSPTNLVSSDST